jgi:transposase
VGQGLGTVRRAGVEGTGSFRAALSRYLLAHGVDVFDVNRPDRTDRRRRGRSDPLDAQNAARAVLSGRARAQAKSGDGPVQIARMYKLAKGSAVKARTQAINQLKAVLVSADPNLREELAGLNNSELFRTCARLADDSKNDEEGEEAVLQATRTTLCLLAQRIGQLTEQIQGLEGRLARLVERHAPQLLTVVGIGPDTAVTLLITIGDNPERLGSEASFAALCGVSPVERSSGSRQYRRLNRGGDPAGQRRPAPDRADPPPLRPAHPGLLRTPHQGGQDPTRNRPMPQTLRCPRGLPPDQGHTVMPPVIGAVVTDERVGRVSETPPKTLQYRCDGPEDAPVLILGPSLGTTWHR